MTARFVCTFCNKTFVQRCHLLRHMKNHTGQYDHFCHICRKGFERKYMYEEHMMVVHEGMRFYCISKNCDKSFTQKHNLIKHIRTAHGEDVELDLSSALMYPKIKMDMEGGDFQWNLWYWAPFCKSVIGAAGGNQWSNMFARRARIALLPFWALFWVKNPFCNRDFLKVPFLSQKIHLCALFWGIIALLFNKLSVPFTITMIFCWKFSSIIAILWLFRRSAPILLLTWHYQLGPAQFYFCLLFE